MVFAATLTVITASVSLIFLILSALVKNDAIKYPLLMMSLSGFLNAVIFINAARNYFASFDQMPVSTGIIDDIALRLQHSDIWTFGYAAIFLIAFTAMTFLTLKASKAKKAIDCANVQP